MKKRIKHNDLVPWFIQDHGALPDAYLASCRKFFKEIGAKQQATSGKLQAINFYCTNQVNVLKIDSTERYKNENK